LQKPLDQCREAALMKEFSDENGIDKKLGRNVKKVVFSARNDYYAP